MDEIVTRDIMRQRGYAARVAGLGRDEHNMNFGADAIKEWQEGYDYRVAEEKMEEKQEVEIV